MKTLVEGGSHEIKVGEKYLTRTGSKVIITSVGKLFVKGEFISSPGLERTWFKSGQKDIWDFCRIYDLVELIDD